MSTAFLEGAEHEVATRDAAAERTLMQEAFDEIERLRAEVAQLSEERNAHLAALCAIADAMYIDTETVSPGVDRYVTGFAHDDLNTIAKIVNEQIPDGEALDTARGIDILAVAQT